MAEVKRQGSKRLKKRLWARQGPDMTDNVGGEPKDERRGYRE